MAFSKLDFCNLYYVQGHPFKDVAAKLETSEQNLNYHMKKNAFLSRDRAINEEDRFQIIQCMVELCSGDDFDADVYKVSIATQRKGSDICNLIYPIWEQKFGKRAISTQFPMISAEDMAAQASSVGGPTVDWQVPIKVYRIDKDIDLPEYATAGAVAIDLRARKAATVRPRAMEIVPCNVVVEIPDGYGLFLLPRSGLAANYAVTLANAPGLVDPDYCGPDDEIKALVINHSANPKTLEIKKGDRICQMIVLPIPKMTVVEVSEPPSGKNRGGLGSTGVQ